MYYRQQFHDVTQIGSFTEQLSRKNILLTFPQKWVTYETVPKFEKGTVTVILNKGENEKHNKFVVHHPLHTFMHFLCTCSFITDQRRDFARFHSLNCAEGCCHKEEMMSLKFLGARRNVWGNILMWKWEGRSTINPHTWHPGLRLLKLFS